MDTGGQERFKAINELYYKNADCCLLVYDITNESSFKEIKDYYINEIKNECIKNVKVILLGNKTDLEEQRIINLENACSLALENNFIFMETSYTKNENVADAFEILIEITYRDKILNNKEKKMQKTNIIISNESNIKDNQCFC